MSSPGSSAAVDWAVGSIVWVRRRNGSWWPGKILGHEDLDNSHITSPRSGTPVKLLGREDASVDYYNLEKSKRVKAFRCGDFDDCIDRVESTQGLTIKKREKYARREDAILHALELEKEMLRKEGKLVENSTDASKERRMVLANGRSNHAGDDVMRYRKRKGEDCEVEAIPQMRGLQDIGLRTAASKRKFSFPNGPGGSNSPASSSGDYSMDRPSYPRGKEKNRSMMEAKRTKYMSNGSKDVLDFSYAGGDRYQRTEYEPPGFVEDFESGSDESETDSSDMEEDTDDDIPLLPGGGRHPERHNTFSRHMSGEEEDESTSSDDEEGDSYESSISGDSSYLYSSHNPDNVSKWDLKGKRNFLRRSTRKREMHRSQKPMGYGLLDYNGTSDETDDTEEYRFSTGIKNIYSSDMLDWDDDDPWEGRNGIKQQRWEEKYDARLIGMKMYDVDLEVRGSYRKGSVPIVSHMSKFNGRAIIGHPVEVEILPDGSSESFFTNEIIYHDKDKPFLLPPAWKTARRSNSRVPRQPAENHSRKKLGPSSSLMRIPRPPGERKYHQQQQQQQQQKKLVKNTNAAPGSQKTRALSSFSSEQAHNVLQEQTNELSNRRVLQGPPTVACIPVKLVFSRLLEKINRPASKPTAKAFKER